MLSKDLFNPNQFFKDAISPFFAESFLRDPQKGHFPSAKSEDFWPRVNVLETDRDYQVQVELPGMKEKDFEVSMEDGVLEISGEKTQSSSHVSGEKNSRFYLQERHTGRFQRQFYIPKGVDSQKVKASYENGLLSVTLEKTASPKKKIQVNGVSA